jgi:hypothetical protein
MENASKDINPVEYDKWLKLKNKSDSDEEKWLYGEYIAKFLSMCPKCFVELFTKKLPKE